MIVRWLVVANGWRISYCSNVVLSAPDNPRPATETGYNSAVNAPLPTKSDPDNQQERHHAAYAREATGLLLIGVLLLILTVIRYWRYIPWSAR